MVCNCHYRDLFNRGCTCGAFKAEKAARMVAATPVVREPLPNTLPPAPPAPEIKCGGGVYLCDPNCPVHPPRKKKTGIWKQTTLPALPPLTAAHPNAAKMFCLNRTCAHVLTGHTGAPTSACDTVGCGCTQFI